MTITSIRNSLCMPANAIYNRSLSIANAKSHDLRGSKV